MVIRTISYPLSLIPFQWGNKVIQRLFANRRFRPTYALLLHAEVVEKSAGEDTLFTWIVFLEFSCKVWDKMEVSI
jgi:hypothetical protein